MQNITARRRADTQLRRLVNLSEQLLSPGSLLEKTKRITDGVVGILDADFARIWLTRPGDICDVGCVHGSATAGPHVCELRDRCLHLVASSGRYTHIDGETHRRVPLGCYKIGRVAVADEPGFLTNDVTNDDRVHDREWARKLGLVSFAGRKLQAPDGETIGVLALFSKHAIRPDEEVLLGTIAGMTSQAILTAQAEESLERKERYYRSLLHNIHEDIVVVDRDYRITDVNEACLTSLGVECDDIIGQPCFELRHGLPGPCNEHGVVCRLKEVFETGEAHSCQREGRRADGSKSFAHVLFSPMLDESGEVTHVIEALRDYTNLAMAQEAMKESEARFRTLFESAVDGILVADAETRKFVMANRQFCAMLGYESGELAGLAVDDIHPEADLPEVHHQFDRIARAEIEVAADVPVLRKDGTVVYSDICATPVEIAGRACLMGIFRDVSSRRRSEERLARVNDCLLGLSTDSDANVNAICALAGELLGGSCALYNRLDHGVLRSWGLWNTPPDYNPVDKAEGHICTDLIGDDDRSMRVIRDLPKTNYAESDPNVLRHRLQTYVGHVVLCDGARVGSLCVLYPTDVEPSEDDLRILGIAASALSAEEERRRATADRQDHVRFLESLDQINRTIQIAEDSEQMLESIAQITQGIFACDRAWIVHACDADAPPEYDSLIDACCPEGLGTGGPAERLEGAQQLCEAALAAPGPITFDVGMIVAIHPKSGGAWLFGVHQCQARTWTKQERRLLQEIGRRVGDGLSSLLILRELKQSETRFRALVEQAADAVFVLDDEGQIVDVNQRASDSLGYTRDELHAMNIADVDVEVVEKQHRERFWETLRPGEPVTFEGVHRRKDDSTFPVEVRLGLLQFDERRLQLGLVRDISERKQTVRALQESERKYRGLVENQPIGVVIHRMDGEVVYVNQAIVSILGYESADDLVGGSVLSFVHPDDIPSMTSRLGAILETGGAQPVAAERLARKDGSYVPAEITGSPISYQGEPAVQVMILDITDRKRAEQERRELEDQLHHSQKLEAVGQLAGGVAHDFNNIITAILGNVELRIEGMRTELGSEHRAVRSMEDIAQAAERAAALTRQLLTFSSRGVKRPEVLDLNKILAGLDKMLRRLISENIVLTAEREDKLWAVQADSGQMEQVIVNLVVNAVHAMPDGGLLTMETRNVILDSSYTDRNLEAQPGPHVLLAVSDTGHGMEAATMARIFEPFFTTKPLNRGTGLGLSTVHGIAKQSDGHVTVHSEPGYGTTFKVYLPVVDVVHTEAPEPQKAEDLRGGETVLVCEDDEIVRELTAALLDSGGYVVLTASGGSEALEVAKSHPGSIDLLVTDVIMPGMNGRMVSEHLQGQLEGLQTLFISGYTADIIAHHGMLDEGVEFLAKPFTRQGLLAKVRDVLGAAPGYPTVQPGHE